MYSRGRTSRVTCAQHLHEVREQCIMNASLLREWRKWHMYDICVPVLLE
jgi:hypothetical protein